MTVSLANPPPSPAAAPLRVLPPLSEWETRVFEGVTLGDIDRDLVARLEGEGDTKLSIEELRTGLRVRARSWVGVIRLETVELRVVPKLAGDQLGLVRLIQAVSGIDALRRLDADATLDAAGDSLLELVALLFADELERLMRRGLLSGYVEKEDELAMVRGRILADRQVLRRFGRLDRVHCRYDELEHDVDENRLLLAALRAVTRHVHSADIHRRLARMRLVLEPVCDLHGVDTRELRQAISYDRLNAHYETAHQLANLILDGLGVEDLFSGGSTRIFAFMIDMSLLFERFVEKVVSWALPSKEFTVSRQASSSSIVRFAETRKPYAKVIPDLVVTRREPGGSSLPIDAKYKLYDLKKIDQGDLYQAFLYSFAWGTKSREGTGVVPPAAVLLYPASGADSKRVMLDVTSIDGVKGARVAAMGLPIPALLEEFEAGMPGETAAQIGDLVSELCLV